LSIARRAEVAFDDKLSGAVRSDRKRFLAVFAEHGDFVARSLRSLGVPAADVDDAAQEVFFVLSRKLASVRTGAEKAFLFGSCLRVASDARRVQARERSRRDDGADVAMMASAERPSDELVERRREREKLDVVLAALPLELRAVFVLFELQGVTLTEAASLLGIPRGTVMSRLRRARELCTEALTKLVEEGAL
jgi:RNA polymerase sigma-70 factor (ECF subfamily)